MTGEPMADSAPNVVDATTASFAQEAIEASDERLVIVDFWATWCAPCRLIGPVLESLAAEHPDEMKLVKVDIDREPALAQKFGVQSIPAIYALKSRKIADAFAGMQPESALRSWLEGLLPTAGELAIKEAAALEASDPAAAEEKYRLGATLDPENPAVLATAGRFLARRGKAEEARALLAQLEARGFLEPEAQQLKAELTLREHAKEAGSAEELRARAAAEPDNLPLKLQLAEALATTGDYAPALDLCLELVERDRKGIGEQARQAMLNIFQVLPPDSPLTPSYRRKLSLLLY